MSDISTSERVGVPAIATILSLTIMMHWHLLHYSAFVWQLLVFLALLIGCWIPGAIVFGVTTGLLAIAMRRKNAILGR